ncbi:flagellar protein FlaG [Paenibacillus sp. YYML68]|uniref:flagellar protein FlaG n=1 Tax=Paenibacillus sp. YYML68 TaxID=2909250 RepID=UPI0024921A7E|nr:flagellar protein FlaG [Paenibacillus sp. YYML68]
MSSDFSIPNSNNKPVTVSKDYYVEPVAKSTEASSDFHQMNSVKELKSEELKGRKVTVGEEELIKAIEKANKALQGITTTFEFKIHEATREIMVKVLDKETGKVVRELPPEKVLDMVAKLWEKAGIIVDERR